MQNFFSLNLGDIYALSTALCWAIAVIFFKLAGQHFKAVPLKILHNLIVTVLFGVSSFIFVGWTLPDLNFSEWSRLLLSAVIGITIADTTQIATIRRLGASGGALIDTLYLPIIMIMSFAFYSEKLGPLELIGGFIVLFAILIGSYSRKKGPLSKEDLIIGCLLGLTTQLGHAGTVMLIKDLLDKEPVLTLSFYRFGFGSLVLLLFYWNRMPRAELFAAFRWDRRILLSIPGAFLGLFLSTFLWFLGFKHTLAGRAAIYNQLTTVFIIILAALFLGEKLTPKRVVAIALAIGGSLLVASA